jgi:hypothetical protein
LEAYVMQHTSCSAKCIQADEEQLEGKSGWLFSFLFCWWQSFLVIKW